MLLCRHIHTLEQSEKTAGEFLLRFRERVREPTPSVLSKRVPQMMKTALQTITWGDPQQHLFDEIFGVANLNGFQGVEIGFRRLGQVGIKKAQSLLAKHRVELSASHIGGNLTDLVQAANERDALQTVLSYLIALNCRYLVFSGLNVEDEGELSVELEKLRSIALGCADQGVTLLYHNHDWEFRNNRRIWNRLQSAEIEGLGYAPDLGWAVKGGQDMGALLDEIGDRTKVLHFKDFVTWEDGQNTCHLGDGVVDFAPAWTWLSRQADRDIWITAEQDNADNCDLACQVNSAFLKNHISEIEG
ncbi:MAG: sugar phosphate isomerase/epimerase [Paracoccaceae bacterium]